MMILKFPDPPSTILAHQAHRPWPLPKQPWVLAQSWNQLLFAHWPVSVDVLRPLIPEQLPIDTFEGQAWVGVVPFYLSNFRARYLPSIPGTSAFCELNVRTYVTYDGKPGVWFFSLDAENALAVFVARLAYHLPYYNARMSLKQEGDTIVYESHRTHRNAPAGEFSATYRPVSPVFRSTPGTLVHWLTERYCLYAADARGRLYRGDIHHMPWPLQDAQADIRVNTMALVAGIHLPDTAPLLHYAERIDMLTWYLARV